MRAHKLNLRLRIAAVLAAVCIAVIAVLGVILYQASEDLEAALVDQIVGEEMDFLIERGAGNPSPGSPSGPNLQYYVLKTAEDRQQIEPRYRELGPGQHSVGAGMNERRVGIRDVGGVRYVVVYDAGAHELRERRFQILMLLAIGAAALVVIGMGYWLAGLLTRQLTDLAAEVPRLTPDAAHPPLERLGQDPEVAALARALDRYHARIVDMMRREQEFTANASHELRTPLTAIRTSCELLATESRLSDKGRARLGMIDAAAEQMTERIEALLYLARQHPPPVRDDILLRECVDQAAAICRDEIARKGLQFEVAIDTNIRLTLDRKALQLVLSNLIKNAVRYTDRGYVRVSYDRHRLTVADSGAGIATEQLPQVFERFYRGEGEADGLGLGLAIVRRICDELGWKIEVASTPGAGSAFSIVLA
jgi:signal transduction histidine kinase